MDATPLVLHEMGAVCDAATQGSANPGLSYGRPLAFAGGGAGSGAGGVEEECVASGHGDEVWEMSGALEGGATCCWLGGRPFWVGACLRRFVRAVWVTFRD